MSDSKIHPAQRFVAPASIQRGTPLKELMNGKLISLIGQSLVDVVPNFDQKRFQARAVRGLKTLELKDRAHHIAQTMLEQMPANFEEISPLLIRSLGPPLDKTEGNGLAPFFYLPHIQLIAAQGVTHFESGMTANYEITKRFTAEFSIRPFLMEHRVQCLEMLAGWVKDSNAHVRRLVSEGTRPRLPWAMRLPEIQENPNLSLPLLEALKDDSELYVRRSVANHLGDIAKDHLDLALEVCERWLDEVNESEDATLMANRRWIVRHALRHPAKKDNAKAVQLRKKASKSKRSKT